MKKLSLFLLLGAVCVVLTVLPVCASSANRYTVIPFETIEETGYTFTAAPRTAPVVLDFRSSSALSKSEGSLYYHDGHEEGRYTFVTDTDGDGALRLDYAPGTGWANLRTMIKYTGSDDLSTFKYMRILYRSVDSDAGNFVVTNNGTGETLQLSAGTNPKNGEWTATNPCNIDGTTILTRLESSAHVTLQYRTTDPDAEVYIREIAFFKTESDAYAYYNDRCETANVPYSEWNVGASGGASFHSGTNCGSYTVNTADETVDIVWEDKVNMLPGGGYMMKPRLGNVDNYNPNNIYVRVLYSASNPVGVDSVNMYFQHDAAEDLVCIGEGITDTYGEFVLTDTYCLGQYMPQRLKNGAHLSFYTDAAIPGGEYRIKTFYFFPTREAADSFSLPESSCELTVAGNPIENYNIVIAWSPAVNTAAAAYALQAQIEELCGVTLPVIYDTQPEGDYEILVGKSSRELSYSSITDIQAEDYHYARSLYELSGDTLIITSDIYMGMDAIMDSFMRQYLYLDRRYLPESIDISGDIFYTGISYSVARYDWPEHVNVSDPEVFSDSFAYDRGYWQEENGADEWSHKNGKYVSSGADSALSYLHVYEPNASFSADFSYSDASTDATAGIMLRYCSEDAYVKAGYDFGRSEWYIDCRESLDFDLNRLASHKAALVKNRIYSIELTVDGENAVFSVDGEPVIEVESVSLISPGRVAVYADGAKVSFDNAEVTLLSGEGTLLRDIVHTKLPENYYIEGGTVTEMTDGSLSYLHHTGITYKSFDNGHTWTKTETWTEPHGYPNILRLNDGKLLQIAYDSSYWYSQTSSDDGKTWTRGANICGVVGAGNMNDKLFQSATTGRIFYSQNYQPASPVDGRSVFCEFYYSDNNGTTWTKSQTDSWEINGGNTQYFGECKMLECADGTIRMYNSWSNYQTIVYSESTDNGRTFGPLKALDGFPCARSSMQFVRDPYADNNTTYYMVWVNDVPIVNSPMPRSRLTLAYSTDGKNWEILGDIWRWEANYMLNGSHIQHLVDPFVQVTKDYVIVGSGASECSLGTANYHHQQRQHIWSIKKSSLFGDEAVIIYGDATGDGKVNPLDLVYLVRTLAGWDGYTLTDASAYALDLNCDGCTDLTDAGILARHIARWSGYTELPYFPGT